MPLIRFLRWTAVCALALLSGLSSAATDSAPLLIDVLDAAAPTAQAVLHGDLDDRFLPLAPALLRAQDKESLWYRIRLRADWRPATPPLLVISGDVRARMLVYLPPDYVAREVSPYATDLDPRYSRHALVFELPRDLRAGQSIYLEMGAPGQTQPMRARVVATAEYQVEDMRHVRISVFLASLQLAMLLVILCFWLVLRDRVFAWFVIYIAGQLIYQLAGTGELYALPGAGLLASLSYHPGLFGATISAAFSISFILEFADLPRNVPRLARALGAMRWPYLVLAIAVWLPSLQPDRWVASLSNLMLVLTTSCALVAGWLAWRRGSRQAGFFLISWLPLLCLTVLRVAQLIFDLPLPAWLEYGLPAAMAYSAIVIAVGLADRTLQVRRERDQAHRLAEFDSLTGVLSRRAILTRLRVAYADARQMQYPLAVLYLDLDHFKRVNDNHGHAAGDSVLSVVAAALQTELRERDWLGRYGGEEFLVVLPDAAELVARNIAERIRQRVADSPVNLEEQQLRLTVSIGVALLDESTPTMESLIAHADSALYRAKAQGRNRVMHYLGEDAGVAALDQRG